MPRTSAVEPAVAARPLILVMDDDRAFLGLLGEFLEEEGYRVVTSATVLSMKQARRLRPDLIVLDIVFGGREVGLGFLTLAQRDRELRRTPVIVCTASVPRMRELAERLAAQNVGVLLKPFDLDQLLRAIEARLPAVTPPG